MTATQKSFVRDSFASVEPMRDSVAMLFYGRLFELDPSLRPMFTRDIGVQGRKLMDMLSALVASLDDFNAMIPVLRALGQRHVAYGVRPDHYDTVGRALLWALARALDTEFHRATREAWKKLIQETSGEMMLGATELTVGRT
jgi:hemoglobin-like flavoprotein